MSGISLSTASQLMQDTSFTTTVKGKTYTGSVSFSDGEYVASDPKLPGASASGSSVQSAETALGTRIDVLA